MESKKFSIQPLNIPIASRDEVYLYVQSLPVAAEILDFMQSLLNAEEKARAARYHFEADRNRFTVARGLLRCILSTYLNNLPENIVFHYGPYAKPYVEDTTVQFNVSHSEDRILIGVGYHQPLGVDVEHMTRAVDIPEIAARFFTENETEQIKALEGIAQRNAFFNVWTRKEALLKALGSGLNVSLKACEVSVGDDAFSTILAADIPSFHRSDWQVCRHLLTDNYVAAAVMQIGLEAVWVMGEGNG